MASSLVNGFSLPPPHVLLFELIASSAAIGFTPSTSWVRPAVVPILSSCVYSIVQNGSQYMRPRWASLLGGFSFAVLLQYIDLGLISRWNFLDGGPATTRKELVQKKPSESSESSRPTGSLSERLSFGWNAMWSFRHVNSPYEVKNVPPFSTTDPTYVPPKSTFLLQKCAIALTCYLLLDLLGARKPPTNAAQIFNPNLIPLFSRWGSVTAAEIKLRALSIAGFGITFYCVIQGSQALAAAIAVGSGLGKIESWRPVFGSLTDAYSLKDTWA